MYDEGDHPGSELAILTSAGKDVTEEFNMIRPLNVADKYAPHAYADTGLRPLSMMSYMLRTILGPQHAPKHLDQQLFAYRYTHSGTSGLA